eukprot:TRINITY_DN7260_c0_g2_i12.p1 TRINITY_DN7260_c0_g2~~TRINITY_DN7260_c0_g2_i12.p1  ORF type:complete len:819 (-),score=343.89 TRINITY_DN7260_c0_g2_i12:261-2717(-)
MAFPPLQVKPEVIYVAVGHHANITWSGGPRRWTDTVGEDVSIKAEAAHQGKVVAELRTHLNQAQITCLDVHQQTLEVRVRNQPSRLNPSPAETVASIEYHCYPVLTPASSSIVVGVGRFHQLNINPHPLIKDVTWFSDDDATASITSTGLVRGVTLGETYVHARVSHPSLTHMPHALDGLHFTVHVTVRFEGFAIHHSTNHLIQCHHTVMHIQGANGEAPGDASFEWVDVEWDSDSNAVSLLPPLASTSEFPAAVLSAPTVPTASLPASQCPTTTHSRTYRGHSVRVAGRSPGRATISARIRVRAPGITPAYFEQKVEINVIEPLDIISARSVLMPFGSRSLITTTLDDVAALSYIAFPTDNALLTSAHLRGGILSVDSRGLIRASTTPGTAMIVVSTNHTFGSQSSTVLVTVAAPNELAVASPTTFSGNMCLGSNLTMSFAVRDRLGRVFTTLDGWLATDGPASLLAFQLSRNDVVRVQKVVSPSSSVAVISSLLVTSLSEGTVVLRVWLANGNSTSPYSSTASDSTLQPLFLTFTVASAAECTDSVDATRVSLRLLSDLNELAKSAFQRRLWENQFRQDVARSLEIPLQRVWLVSVNTRQRVVELEIIPAGSGASSPLVLAQHLLLQIADRLSPLYKGSASSQVDSSYTPRISRIPFIVNDLSRGETSWYYEAHNQPISPSDTSAPSPSSSSSSIPSTTLPSGASSSSSPSSSSTSTSDSTSSSSPSIPSAPIPTPAEESSAMHPTVVAFMVGLAGLILAALVWGSGLTPKPAKAGGPALPPRTPARPAGPSQFRSPNASRVSAYSSQNESASIMG